MSKSHRKREAAGVYVVREELVDVFSRIYLAPVGGDPDLNDVEPYEPTRGAGYWILNEIIQLLFVRYAGSGEIAPRLGHAHASERVSIAHSASHPGVPQSRFNSGWGRRETGATPRPSAKPAQALHLAPVPKPRMPVISPRRAKDC